MLTLKAGDVFAGCNILCVSGQGGSGVVYLAEDALGKQVALKLVNTVDKEREMRGVKCYMDVMNDSPYLLKIMHVGIERGELFYIMEAADPVANSPVYLADTLDKRLKLNGRLDPENALDIVRKIASAVAVLHRAGLIHRDIKPENIIFAGGAPKLSDPGLICAFDSSFSFAGTLGFLPPECFRGEANNDQQGDIYALGMLFYCMVTGESPGRFPGLPRDLSFSLCRKLLPVLLKACNAKKKKRYASIEEFERELPTRLPRPGLWERYSEKFRTWRLLHHRIFTGILLGLLVAAALGTYAVRNARRKERLHREETARRMQMRAELRDKFRRGGVRLMLQLERVLGENRAAELAEEVKNLPSVPAEAAECEKLRKDLNGAAASAASEIGRIPDAFRRVAEEKAFFDTPLAAWLDGAEREKLQKEFAADEKKNLKRQSGSPRPGEDFFPDSSHVFDFAYIPPGEFISPRTGKKLRIDYPFWVGRTELTVRQFSRMCRFLPPGSGEQEKPAVQFLWNDLIHGCRNANGMFQIIAPFPPGYVARPLTEEEWEYCATAGMTQEHCDNEYLAGKKAAGPQRTGQLPPNRFGLYDMLGNVQEMVVSGERSHAGSYVVRGGNWKKSAADALTERTELVYFQSFLRNVGTRIAIAPGTPDLYEKEVRTGTPNHLIYKGKHYEFFGHLCACFSRKEAEDTCKLLGGRLASLDSPELCRKIYETSDPTVCYLICVAADFRDGKWFWSNGKEIQNAPGAPAADQFFVMKNGVFELGKVKRYLGFVCEWSEEEWNSRKKWRNRLSGKWPQHVSFRLGDRDYVLFRIFGYPHLLRRYAEILGGKVAEPKTPGSRQQLSEKIKRFSDKPAMLGGFWKNGEFRWSDGEVIGNALPLLGQVIDSAPSLSTPALKDGELCAVQLADQFLIEFPAADPDRR